MSDDPISLRDGPSWSEMHWRDEHDRITPPVFRAVLELKPPTHRTCTRCGYDPAGDPSAGELASLVAYIETGSQKMAAARRGITVQTIKNQLSHLYARTGCENGVQAAYRLGRGDWAT